MRVQDEELWSAQLEEFDADETSRKFREFLVFWVDAAEKIEKENRQTPIDGLRHAFDIAEQTFGYVSTDWLGQFLLVIVQHWVYGDEVWESLSVWERRMVEQSMAIKLAELQDSAKNVETPAVDEFDPNEPG